MVMMKTTVFSHKTPYSLEHLSTLTVKDAG